MNIIEKFIKKNKYSRPGTKRQVTSKIAWHYTGQNDVDAIKTVNYFHNLAKGYELNGKYIYASSHYVVGLEGEIYYIVPENEIAYTTNAANSYSIGIECATTGEDDHYTELEYKAMVELGVYLCKKYNLNPIDDFIRHYDVTGKICPRYFVNNEDAWNKFKQDVYDEIHKITNGCYNKVARVNCNEYLNVRGNRPSVTGELAPVIDQLKNGKLVTLGYVYEGWASIFYDNKHGYVNVKYLDLIE